MCPPACVGRRGRCASGRSVLVFFNNKAQAQVALIVTQAQLALIVLGVVRPPSRPSPRRGHSWTTRTTAVPPRQHHQHQVLLVFLLLLRFLLLFFFLFFLFSSS